MARLLGDAVDLPSRLSSCPRFKHRRYCPTAVWHHLDLDVERDVATGRLKIDSQDGVHFERESWCSRELVGVVHRYLFQLKFVGPCRHLLLLVHSRDWPSAGHICVGR
jgi:hypothetical protein